MPSSYIKKISKNCKIPINICEKFWNEAKEQVGEGNWGLVTNIFKLKCKKWLTEKGRKVCDELK